jgi:aryl-alcohol dehydrogenase-like predicted oxidoreductase
MMKYRRLGRTGWKVSEVSFGAWAIGGSWGKVDDHEALKALHHAVDQGVNFFDTADVYGDGHSERLLSELKRSRKDEIIIATKAGRRLNPHIAEGYTAEHLTAFIERSLKNLDVEALDLVQLHCPPTQVYYMPEVFDTLDDLTRQGKIKYYGVSVEKVEEGLKALEYPNVQTIQIIFNIFRQRPLEFLLPLAVVKQVGILARVPLASGLLTGKMRKRTKFEADDHRNFNRHGEAFDQGETFSGVDYILGLQAVDEIKKFKPKNMTMVQFALKWILMNSAVSCAIPGARTVEQVDGNVSAADLEELSARSMEKVDELYERLIKPQVHQRW